MKAIVVHKIPKIEVLRAEAPERAAALESENPDAMAAMLAAAAKQAEANAAVADALAAAGYTFESFSRVEFANVDEVPADVDLVVTVGGDGTVLDVAHRVRHQPMVGINSDPDRSVGYFCAGDCHAARGVFERFAEGRARSTQLHRIQLAVDGVPTRYACMNDLLVTNRNPAMMSRYLISAGGRTEAHASSGMWISTPAGSTAGIRSAGGTVLPLDGALIQYLIREPYTTGDATYPLSRGVRHLHEGLELESRMEDGCIYVDGPFIEVPFPIGTRLTLSEGTPLRMIELDPLRRER